MQSTNMKQIKKALWNQAFLGNTQGHFILPFVTCTRAAGARLHSIVVFKMGLQPILNTTIEEKQLVCELIKR